LGVPALYIELVEMRRRALHCNLLPITTKGFSLQTLFQRSANCEAISEAIIKQQQRAIPIKNNKRS